MIFHRRGEDDTRPDRVENSGCRVRNHGVRELRHLGREGTRRSATLALKWVLERHIQPLLGLLFRCKSKSGTMQNKNITHSREVTIAYVFCSHLNQYVTANWIQAYGPNWDRYVSTGELLSHK